MYPFRVIRSILLLPVSGMCRYFYRYLNHVKTKRNSLTKYFFVEIFSCIAAFLLLQLLRIFCRTVSAQIPSLNRYENVKRGKWLTQTTKLDFAHHIFCWVIILYPVSHFSALSRNVLKYRSAKKYSTPKHDVTFQCKFCYEQFLPWFKAWGQDKNKIIAIQSK